MKNLTEAGTRAGDSDDILLRALLEYGTDPSATLLNAGFERSNYTQILHLLGLNCLYGV